MTTARKNPDSRPPVVLMGLTVTGLAVARALGRRGIEVVAAHPDPEAPNARSRYLRSERRPRFDDPQAVLNFYLDLGRRLGSGAVLLPTGDRNVLFVSKYREELARHYFFQVCDPEVLETISSKRRLVAVAERLGLPLPPTLLPADRAELEKNLHRLRFPCVVKPEFTHLWQSSRLEGTGARGAKALPVESEDELFALYDRLSVVDSRLVVQQMIVGPDRNHESYQALVDQEGATRAEFIGRKLRLAPAHYGMGSYVESIHSDELRDTAREVVGKLGYRGMVGVQFKRDSRDDKLYLLELGIRFNVYTGLAVACGIDFPFYCYQTCRHAPFEEPNGYPSGKRWINPVDDLRAMRVYARDGSWTWGSWLRSVLRCPVNAYFAWDDPVPALAVLSRSLAAAGGRILGR